MAKRRVLLVHWNASEARERASRLRDAGYTVGVHSEAADGKGFKRVRANPPDAVVIDLDRLPSHGRAVGVWLRQTKATRRVPILYVGGTEERVVRARRVLPDAVFTTWRRLRMDLRRAIEAPSQRLPIVPDTMVEYGRVPIVQKLRIREDTRVALVKAPTGFEALLGERPANVQVRRTTRGKHDIVVLFATTQAELARRWAGAVGALDEGGGLWIAWPKKQSGLAKDLGGPAVRAYGVDRGFVDYRVCAIDDTWSGLLFARRKI